MTLQNKKDGVIFQWSVQDGQGAKVNINEEKGIRHGIK
jgi:hypothetical protein